MNSISRTIGALIATIVIGLLAACGQKTAEQKVADQTSRVHPLTADERLLAEANGKNFFQKEWAFAGNKRGQLVNCRPSDSNFNGLVSCDGMVPQPDGTFKEVRRYCGYRPEMVGCSDEDTVK